MSHSAAVLARQQETLRRLRAKEQHRQRIEEKVRAEAQRIQSFDRTVKYKRQNQARKWARWLEAYRRWFEALPEELRFTLRIQALDWWDGPNPQPRSSWRRIERFANLEIY